MVRNFTEVLYDNETIITDRIILRKFKKTDAGDVLEYGSDPEAMKYLIWDGVKTIDEAMVSIVEYDWKNPGNYAIELKEESKCIGSIGITIEPEHEKASFGYVLNRHYWNKGYMTEVLTAVIKLCFEKLELNRVEATHYMGNPASGKVMQNCGMLFEGTGIKEVKVKGVFQDVAHYAVTREQWLKTE